MIAVIKRDGKEKWCSDLIRWKIRGADRRQKAFPHVCLQQWADVGPTGLHQHGSPKAGAMANPPKTLYNASTHAHMLSIMCADTHTVALNISIWLYCNTRSCSWLNAQWCDNSVKHQVYAVICTVRALVILLPVKSFHIIIGFFLVWMGVNIHSEKKNKQTARCRNNQSAEHLYDILLNSRVSYTNLILLHIMSFSSLLLMTSLTYVVLQNQ